MCSISNLIALPFALIPSDAPLSLLEASSLGRPVLTTRLGSLPELVEGGRAYLAEPNDLPSLVQTLLQAADEIHETAGRPRLPQRGVRTWADVGREWSEFLRSI
jgi:glycosyltransferase involved in cell wall biosynthesis